MNAAAMSMLEILAYVEAELARGAQTITLDVLDPDVAAGTYAGERIDGLVHRPLRTWLDLAERLRLRMRTPERIDPRMLRLTFERITDERVAAEHLGDSANAIGDNLSATTEKYGAASEFARIRKLEDPRFVIDLREALDRVLASFDAHVGTSTASPNTASAAGDARERPIRILDLGVNTGDELALLLRAAELRGAEIVGVDHSASAVSVARDRFADNANVRLIEADIRDLAAQALGRFDLVVCIGTLQSGALDDRELLRSIVQDHLAPGGAVILGMPNCRYVDGEVEYGARIVNITQPELGLLVKDVAFYRKYLQQHHKKVFVTGKHYILVTAVAT
ncbi:MAG TPA: class I SAM-dependent methyltransferase [Kofleriaceae bacterium]|nr:class I SAM-dependent methyltransferase [Kofleriaceae bacterium]